MLVQYLPETELRAGRTFAAVLHGEGARGATFRIGPFSSAAQLDTIARAAHGAGRVVIATYVRRIEGEGGFAIPARLARWIEELASHERTVVVSFGNPYLLRQFPAVGSYLAAYGISDDLERAAADVLTGRAAVGGTIPVSLPGLFTRGDGLTREVRPAP